MNIREVDAVHADFLRGAKHTELASAPDDQLVLVRDRSREPTSSCMHDVMDVKLLEFERRVEVVLDGLGRLAQSHLVPPIRAETVQAALDRQN